MDSGRQVMMLVNDTTMSSLVLYYRLCGKDIIQAFTKARRRDLKREWVLQLEESTERHVVE